MNSITSGFTDANSPTWPTKIVGAVCGADDNEVPVIIASGSPVAWYKVVGNGRDITVSTCSANSGGSASFDTEISVFESCDPSTDPATKVVSSCVAGNGDDPLCGDAGTQTYGSTVTWPSELGKPYFLLVHGYQGETGEFNLDLSFTTIITGTELPKDIPDAQEEGTLPAFVGLPFDCKVCTIKNVAITVGINHSYVEDLDMTLLSPGDTEVFLLRRPSSSTSSANLVADNKITFDDSAPNPQDPQVWNNLGEKDSIPAGTYRTVDSSLGLFDGTVAEGNWFFIVTDKAPGDTGTIESVELEITCEEEKITCSSKAAKQPPKPRPTPQPPSPPLSMSMSMDFPSGSSGMSMDNPSTRRRRRRRLARRKLLE